MFKKNKALSIFGIMWAVSFSALNFGQEGAFACLRNVDIVKLMLFGALGGISIYLLIQSLRNGANSK